MQATIHNCTWGFERQILTMRMHMRRFTRLTNAWFMSIEDIIRLTEI